MADVVFILATLGFFAVAIVYVRGCNRLKSSTEMLGNIVFSDAF